MIAITDLSGSAFVRVPEAGAARGARGRAMMIQTFGFRKKARPPDGARGAMPPFAGGRRFIRFIMMPRGPREEG